MKETKKLRKTIIRQRDYAPSDAHGEYNDLPSVTVPNEVLSIREIMQKHVSGMKILDELRKQPVYDSGADFDSEDLEKIQNMDLFDLQQEKERIDLFLKKHTQTPPSPDSLVNQAKGEGDSQPVGNQNVKATRTNDEGSSEKRHLSSDDSNGE